MKANVTRLFKQGPAYFHLMAAVDGSPNFMFLSTPSPLSFWIRYCFVTVSVKAETEIILLN